MSSSVSTLEENLPAPAVDGSETKLRSKRFAAKLRRLLREPLVHFLLIGFAIFVVYGLLSPAASQTGSSRIVLTEQDLQQLQMTWMTQWKRLPTPEELRGLIDAKVQQEILYREALSQGLDQNDEIIKRRLAQKMEFLAEDVSKIREPESEELKSWFLKNSARFALPGNITFRHLYFSPDKRGPQTQHDATQALQSLSGKTVAQTNESEIGDRFMDQNYFAECSPEQVAKVFGIKFSEKLFTLTPGSWQGPVESGLGWHLVWVESITPGRVPAFEEVDPEQVKSEWTTERREETKRKTFDAIKQRYEIVLPR